MTNFPTRRRQGHHPPQLRGPNLTGAAEKLKADFPRIWRAGGNIRGNSAFTLGAICAGDYPTP